MKRDISGILLFRTESSIAFKTNAFYWDTIKTYVSKLPAS